MIQVAREYHSISIYEFNEKDITEALNYFGLKYKNLNESNIQHIIDFYEEHGEINNYIIEREVLEDSITGFLRED